MRIVVINGTEVKGCTYQIKEIFLNGLQQGNEISQFYLPKDLPYFCTGCKTCFMKSEEYCPHAEFVKPIWKAILNAELLVFTSPTYALRATAQMKTLLDHLCVHWMVHRPEEAMFDKKAVILVNAIGPFTGGAIKDITTSLSWLGVSHIKTLGVGLMEGVIWNELSKKRKHIITSKVNNMAQRYRKTYTAKKGIKVSLKFSICKAMHKATASKTNTLSADDAHWVSKGWINTKQGAK